jgi:hypothetical protein
MPTLRDALKFDAHLGAVAEHGGYVLTVVKDRSTGYRLSVALEGKRPHAERHYRTLERLEEALARGDIVGIRVVEWWPAEQADRS